MENITPYLGICVLNREYSNFYKELSFTIQNTLTKSSIRDFRAKLIAEFTNLDEDEEGIRCKYCSNY